ncbi:MAG: MOSC domain-containing protein [Chloroflexi bacterium]|nr:MOSC domain-containing protein [Chloroflexota bacterium]MCI0580602.1 MOSC domain-containing protein [Chloroflexota bacterium]MCI0648876.1 MOSC domain-containing protein [Chloroflexota bacterium]MCI0728206.1 MOSC domain-containing protein [Chloroflexota bacterium]
MNKGPFIHSIYIGRPQTLTDKQGTWRSSIYRSLVDGPVALELHGLVGDRATQPYHGTADLAVCCHFLDHYRFWNEQYGMALQPGGVGENWTLENGTEETVCIGDVYRVGTGLVQVSGPRTPCETQARRVGRADWVKLTLQEGRTGIYLRVLEPGMVQAGDALHLVERPNPEGTIAALLRCYFHDFDRELAGRFAMMPGLMVGWQRRFAERM